jgi:hypothetical protein
MLLRSRITLGALASLVGAAAHGQLVAVGGYTNGCFGAPCTLAAPNVFQTASLAGLVYESARFDVLAGGGPTPVSAPVNALGVREVNNLGAIYLTSQLFEYAGATFDLAVAFQLPGVGTLNVPARLTGFVRAGSEVSGVGLDFDNTPRTFGFAVGGAPFMLSLVVDAAFVVAPLGNDVFSVPIIGRVTIQQAVVPEPSTLGLAATGLLALVVGHGVGVSRRGRRRRGAAAMPRGHGA